MAKKKIAIIGAGVAGTSLVKFFVNDSRFDEHYELDLYDGKRTMGRGYAYQSDDEDLIVNLPAELMSLTSDQDDYINWLKDNDHKVQSYTSRSLYGQYIHSTLMNFVHEHKNINLVEHLVDDLVYDDKEEKYVVYTDGEYLTYDAVFLTNGEMSYSDPYDLKGEEKYIYDPYPIEENLNDLDGEIGIIGSGLSAIDCIRYLLKQGHSKISVLSRSGELPSVRGTYYDMSGKHFTVDKVFTYEKEGLIPLDRVVELFKNELQLHDIDPKLLDRKVDRPEIDLKYDLEHPYEVGKIQYLITSLEDTFKDIYKYLSRADKKRFLDDYHDLIQGNHSPMPVHGAKQILEWIDQGSLEFLDGMESVEVNEGFKVTFDDGKETHFDVLINATGPVSDVRQDDTLLIKNMYNRLLIEADEFGGVLIDKHHRIISPRFGTLNNFYTIGALTVGSDYLIKGVTMLAKETEDLVEHYLNHN